MKIKTQFILVETNGNFSTVWVEWFDRLSAVSSLDKSLDNSIVAHTEALLHGHNNDFHLRMKYKCPKIDKCSVKLLTISIESRNIIEEKYFVYKSVKSFEINVHQYDH